MGHGCHTCGCPNGCECPVPRVVKQHYCKECKRLVPLSPNTNILDWAWTLGVPHVQFEVKHASWFSNPPCGGAGLYRNFCAAEQEQNLLEMDLD